MAIIPEQSNILEKNSTVVRGIAATPRIREVAWHLKNHDT